MAKTTVEEEESDKVIHLTINLTINNHVVEGAKSMVEGAKTVASPDNTADIGAEVE